MWHRLKNLIADFPRQFWILFGGTLVNQIGSGMVFPFLTLYLHQRLNLSMTLVGVILSIWAISGLLGSLVGGSLADQMGRKRLMVTSLGTNALGLVAFGFADTLPTAVAAVVFVGFVSSMFQPARDAMVADLVDTDKRPQAYGLLRVVANLGIGIGPAIGGFLASVSYLIAFLSSASATLIFFFITLFMMLRPSRPLRRGARRVRRRPVVLPLSFAIGGSSFSAPRPRSPSLPIRR
jgi:MFS family permease